MIGHLMITKEFLEILPGLKGKYLVSGYAHDLYDSALNKCKRIEKPTLADGAKKRTEILWIS
jgi:hypothetical protein